MLIELNGVACMVFQGSRESILIRPPLFLAYQVFPLIIHSAVLKI